MKQTIRTKVNTKVGPEVVTGEELKSDDPVLSFLQGLSTQKGWHMMASPRRHGHSSVSRRQELPTAGTAL